MKKYRMYTLIVIAMVVVLGMVWYEAHPQKNPESPIPVVAATIFPVYDLTRTIAGEDVQTKLILPPGTSSHTFDPTPKQLQELQDVERVFSIGHDFDTWIEHVLPEKTLNIPVDTHIVLREFGENTHNDNMKKDTDNRDSKDPHYWLDPRNAKIMARTIEKALAEAYPEYAENFATRTDAFIYELDTQITHWEQDVTGIENTSFATLHDAFSYLADFANIKLTATFEPFPGKEPTPQYLAELTQKIKKYHIKAVFTEPQLSFSGIEAFAADTGIQTGILDPLGGIDERLSYITLIEYNIHTLVDALK